MNKQIVTAIVVICIFATFGTTYAIVNTYKDQENRLLKENYERTLNENISYLTAQITELSNRVNQLSYSVLAVSLPPAINQDEYSIGDVIFDQDITESQFVGTWFDENGNTYTFDSNGTYHKTGTDNIGLPLGDHEWEIGKEADKGIDIVLQIIRTTTPGYGSQFSCKFYHSDTHLFLSSHGSGQNTAYLIKVG